MSIKTSLNYSTNFNSVKRKKNQIKFLIFHYTGMKSEKSAICRLTKIQSMVSSHYFIKKNGEVINIVPDLYIAWHAGVSSWGKYKSLNKYSIGIEISNPGHKFGYKNFTKIQIKNLIKLSKFLIDKYNIKKPNILGHSDIAPERKIDPGEKFPWAQLHRNNVGIWHKINKVKLRKLRNENTTDKEKKLFKKKLIKLGYSSSKSIFSNNIKFDKLLVKAFQRRFRQKLINNKIDQECLLIINNLTNNNR